MIPPLFSFSLVHLIYNAIIHHLLCLQGACYLFRHPLCPLCIRFGVKGPFVTSRFSDLARLPHCPGKSRTGGFGPSAHAFDGVASMQPEEAQEEADTRILTKNRYLIFSVHFFRCHVTFHLSPLLLVAVLTPACAMGHSETNM